MGAGGRSGRRQDHHRLSVRAPRIARDLNWPLSMSFLQADLQDRGRRQNLSSTLSSPLPGLLSGGKEVLLLARSGRRTPRACGGPWSATWSFTARARRIIRWRSRSTPGCLALEAESPRAPRRRSTGSTEATRRGIFGGQRPGRTPPYRWAACKELLQSVPLRNFMAETRATEMPVLGRDVITGSVGGR